MLQLPAHGIACLIVCSMCFATANASETGTKENKNSAGVQEASSGWTVYLDPHTGKLIDSPSAAKSTIQLSKNELYMFTTDDFGLIERKMPDGGYALGLQGRFRQGAIAIIKEDQSLEYRNIGGDMFVSEAGKRVRELMRREMKDNGTEGSPE